MIRSKTKQAFTLIEVLITMAIMSIALGPIYFAQGTIFKRIVNSIAAVERMFIAHDFFVDKQRDDDIGDKRVQEHVDDPKTDMTYQMLPVPKESILSKTCNHLFVQKTSWKWQDMNVSHEDVFVSIVFNPPPKEPFDTTTSSPLPGSAKATPDTQGNGSGPQPAQAPAKGAAQNGNAVKPATPEALNVKK